MEKTNKNRQRFEERFAGSRTADRGSSPDQAFLSLLELLGAAVFIYSEEGLIYVNNEAEELSGYPRSELRSIDVLRVLHPDDRDRVAEELYKKSLDSEAQVRVETRIVRKDGEIRWVSLGWRHVEMEGVPVSIGYGLDITELKKTQAAARQSEQHFRTLAETTPAAIFLHKGKEMVYANPASARLTGYSVEELKEMNFWEAVHPEDAAMVRERGLARQKGEEVPASYEVRILTKRKQQRWAEIMGNPVTVEGEPAVLGTALDITARKLAEEALQASEELYRSLIQTSPDAIIVTDLNGQIMMVNQRAFELFGASSAEELVSKEIFSLLAKGEGRRAQGIVEKTLREGSVTAIEYRLLRLNGEEFLGEMNASRIAGTDGTAQAFLCVVRDITARRQAEEMMIRAEKLESVGLLAGGIAHDFNNIMTAVLGNIALGRRAMSRDPAAARRRLEAAEQAVVDAKHLTQQLLTFSRGGEPITQTADLAALLREATTLALSGSNVEATFSLPEKLGLVDVDVGQINQVISNLVINASQAMPDGGWIEVSACEREITDDELPPLAAGKCIVFAIADKGAGIPEKDLAHVFDPYFTTKNEGSGLGLASCHSIIRRHGGTIAVESELGRGSTFRVTLPASVTGENSDSGARRGAVTNGRILVMDDDDVVREVAIQMLAESGFEAVGACDGQEAIERYRVARETGSPFAAVILDLTVPGGMGGKEAVIGLKKVDPKVKAIVSSGYSNDPVMSEFYNYGFEGVVTKPFTFEELQDTVYEVLGKW